MQTNALSYYNGVECRCLSLTPVSSRPRTRTVEANNHFIRQQHQYVYFCQPILPDTPSLSTSHRKSPYSTDGIEHRWVAWRWAERIPRFWIGLKVYWSFLQKGTKKTYVTLSSNLKRIFPSVLWWWIEQTKNAPPIAYHHSQRVEYFIYLLFIFLHQQLLVCPCQSCHEYKRYRKHGRWNHNFGNTQGRLCVYALVDLRCVLCFSCSLPFRLPKAFFFYSDCCPV